MGAFDERKLAVVYRPVDALTAAPRNARTHGQSQIKQIANAIAKFGFTSPVLVDEKGQIIAGHGRWAAAKLAGLVEVPTIELAGLSDAQQRALVLADNKLALNSGWDNGLLALELADLAGFGADMALTGFTFAEIDKINGVPSKPAEPMVYEEKFAIVIACENEPDQKTMFDTLTALGYSCKVLVN